MVNHWQISIKLALELSGIDLRTQFSFLVTVYISGSGKMLVSTFPGLKKVAGSCSLAILSTRSEYSYLILLSSLHMYYHHPYTIIANYCHYDLSLALFVAVMVPKLVPFTR